MFRNNWNSTAAVFKFVGGDQQDLVGQLGDPSANNRTGFWLVWKDNSGTLRFQEVRTSLSGEVDGTSRRYLFVSEI